MTEMRLDKVTGHVYISTSNASTSRGTAGVERVDVESFFILLVAMSTITMVVCSERTRQCFHHRRWVRVVFRLPRVRETV